MLSRLLASELTRPVHRCTATPLDTGRGKGCMYAGADFMLVPSRFEPCGLIQLHAMNYGTVPLVASTGAPTNL